MQTKEDLTKKLQQLQSQNESLTRASGDQSESRKQIDELKNTIVTLQRQFKQAEERARIAENTAQTLQNSVRVA